MRRAVGRGKAAAQAGRQVLPPEPGALGDFVSVVVEVGEEEEGRAVLGQDPAIDVVRVLGGRDLGQSLGFAVEDEQVVMLVRVKRLGEDQAAAVGGDRPSVSIRGGAEPSRGAHQTFSVSVRPAMHQKAQQPSALAWMFESWGRAAQRVARSVMGPR